MDIIQNSPSSALVQLTRMPAVIGFRLGRVIGPRSFGMVDPLIPQALRAFRFSPRGIYADPSAVPGVTDDERAELVRMFREGWLEPEIPRGLTESRGYDAGSSMLKAAGIVNRILAWLSYHRAAQLPGADLAKLSDWALYEMHRPGQRFQCNANYLRLLYRNFLRMGPQGEVAGLMMLKSLAGSERNLVTEIEPHFDKRFRELLHKNFTNTGSQEVGQLG